MGKESKNKFANAKAILEIAMVVSSKLPHVKLNHVQSGLGGLGGVVVPKHVEMVQSPAREVALEIHVRKLKPILNFVI